MQSLRVGGFLPMTTIDYPDNLAAVVFCQGCSWRCRYCHNAKLISSKRASVEDWKSIFHFLKKRVGLLDAVVFSGGEPTLQKELSNAMQEVKQLGFKLGLHTAGIYPHRLEHLLPYVDWVGLDIKTLPDLYPEITGVPKSGVSAWNSLELLLKANKKFECRTTVHWNLINARTLFKLGEKLAAMGVTHYAVQNCQVDTSLDTSLPTSSISDTSKKHVLQALEKLFPYFEVRGTLLHNSEHDTVSL